jgi:bacillithiol biosynthesis deacetylase BshB1
MDIQPLDILVFGAHPDDAEIGMGATIYKHTKAGFQVGICDLTQAEMSSNGSVQTREREAADASMILGLAARSNLGLPDRGLFMNTATIEQVTREIRKRRPRIVFAPYWQDRHPDHVMSSRLVGEAVFNAKLRNYMPEDAPVTVEHVYYYFINDQYEPQLIVDVSEEYTVKMNALRAYKTQFELADEASSFVPTLINQGFLERIEAKDRWLGQKANCNYAEGFATKLPFRIDYFK